MSEQPQQNIEELVESLLQPTVDALLNEVKTYMTTNAKQLSDRLDAIEKRPTEAPKDENSTKGKAESAMEQRIKALETQLQQAEEARQAQEKAAQAMRFDSALGGTLDAISPMHKQVVQELLANRMKQDSVEKDGMWLTKDGKTMDEAVKGFFETPEGKHFLPSQHKDGAGTKEPVQTKTEQKLSTHEMLAQAFLNG